MKTAKLELSARDAANLYRCIGAYERELVADKDIERSVVAMSIAELVPLKDQLARIFERTRPIPNRKKEGVK